MLRLHLLQVALVYLNTLEPLGAVIVAALKLHLRERKSSLRRHGMRVKQTALVKLL